MLDQRHGRALIRYAWENIGCQVELPEDEQEFFAKRGLLRREYDDRRRFCRFFFRQQMVLVNGRELECVYSADLSRAGIAFLHHKQMFPKQEVAVILPNGRMVRVVIARCRKLSTRCYLCGSKILEVVGKEDFDPEEDALK